MHVLQQRRTPLVVALVAGGLVHFAIAAPTSAQDYGPAARLGSPTGGEHQPPPPIAAPVQPGLDEVPIPPPPGAPAEQSEVRYPIPSEEHAAAAEEPTIRIPSRITTRLRSLDANLQALAARGGGNVVNAVLSLLTGGLAITIGALHDPNYDEVSVYLYVYGGIAAVRGILDFVMTPDAQSAAITYEHMPMTTAGEVRDRLRFGERALAGLAEQSLIARVLDASLNMAAGAAVVPIVLAPKGFGLSDPLDWFVLIAAGVSIVSGIVTLATTSPAEQRWSAYQQLRERLRQERREELEEAAHHDADEPTDEPAEDDTDAELDAEAEALLLRPSAPGPQLTFGVSPAPNGAFAGLGLAF